MGMNNPDTSSGINASYLINTQKFIELCIENGVTPIISTIPSTWGTTSDDSDVTQPRNNRVKNAWVKESGCRYIDWADAVENPDGSGWYAGMLYTDGVHPTERGAIALADRFVRDFPEIAMER
jgi:lysophospholipase L1-like esterase